MKVKYLLVICSLFICNIIASQNTFDIIFPGNDRDQKCQQCFQIFNQKPKEVQFSIKREKDNLYFQVNDKNWFNQLFKNEGDGIAVDIVLKDRYKCDYESVENTQIRGLLQKPVYSQKLKSGLKPRDNNYFRVHVGRIPEAFLNDELEYNILFLSNKNLCNYYTIYNLESYPWDLLDMGMYLDSLTYDAKEIKATAKEGYILKNKTLKFKIPFEKNKSEYSPIHLLEDQDNVL